MTLKFFLLIYFLALAIIFGAFDFAPDRERKLMKQNRWLECYSKFFCLLFLLIFPLSIRTFFFTSAHNDFQPLMLIMWSLEYLMLLLMTSLFYFTAVTNKKSIIHLIKEGVRIFKDMSEVQKVIKTKDKEEEEKTLRIFLMKLIFDHISLISEIIVSSQNSFDELEAKILTLICFLMNFVSFLVSNAFVLILILIRFRFQQINRNMVANIMHEDNLSFAKDVQSHRTLRFFCEKIVKVFSKICIANFLYIFTTTLSWVS